MLQLVELFLILHPVEYTLKSAGVQHADYPDYFLVHLELCNKIVTNLVWLIPLFYTGE